MTDCTFKILTVCQDEFCAEETSYPLDMLRWWDRKPICERCFNDLPYPDVLKDNGEDVVKWTELRQLQRSEARV